MTIRLAWILALGFAASLLSTPSAVADDDWFEEKVWKEDALALPGPVQRDSLVEIVFSSAATHRVFVDTASLSVGEDRVVRYALVTESSGGASNVSFEGLRCDTQERRIYALGHPDGSWHPVRRGAWKPYPTTGANSPYKVLAKEYFCPAGVAVGTREQALQLLRAGGRALRF